jgi:hypothetical protein
MLELLPDTAEVRRTRCRFPVRKNLTPTATQPRHIYSAFTILLCYPTSKSGTGRTDFVRRNKQERCRLLKKILRRDSQTSEEKLLGKSVISSGTRPDPAERASEPEDPSALSSPLSSLSLPTPTRDFHRRARPLTFSSWCGPRIRNPPLPSPSSLPCLGGNAPFLA